MTRVSIFMASVLLLAGCGGGGDNNSSSTTIPAKPTISLQAASYDENTSVTISPTVSTAGSITSYEWRVVSGDLTLDQVSSRDLSFSVPTIDQDQSQTVTLELTVVDNHQQSTSAQADFTFNSVSPSVTMPTISITEKDTAIYTVEIEEQGQDVVSVEWAYESGEQYDFTIIDELTIEITAPEVKQDLDALIRVTVTDADGDVATQDGRLVFEQITIPVTIEGITLSNIEPGAHVVATNLADNSTDVTYTTLAGEYSLELQVDDEYVDGLIAVEVQGNPDQKHMHLISMLGDLSSLVAAAADDGAVSVDEVPAVAVTQITTAEYGMAYSTSDSDALRDFESYADALLHVGYHDVLNLSAAVMAYIYNDLSDEFSTAPSSISNSRQLVEQVYEAKDFIHSLYATQTFEDALNDILYTDLLVDETPWQLENEYFLLSGRGWYSHNNLEVVRDGVILFGSLEHSYQVDDDMLQMTADSIRYDHVQRPDADYYDYATVTSEYERSVQKILSSNGSNVWRVVTTAYEVYTFDDGVTYDDNWEDSYLVQAVPVSAVQDVRNFDLHYAYLPLDYNLFINELETEQWYQSDEFVFNADGSGSMSISGKDFVWGYSGSKLEVLFGNTRLLYSVIDKKGEIIALSTNSSGETSTFTSYGSMADSSIAWSDQSVAGIYTYKNRVLKSSSMVEDYYWFNLSSNGGGTREVVYDYDDNGVLTRDEHYQEDITWYIDNGVLVILESTSYYDRERVWLLVAQDDGEHAILQLRITDLADGWEYPDLSNYRLLDKSDIAPIDVSALPN